MQNPLILDNMKRKIYCLHAMIFSMKLDMPLLGFETEMGESGEEWRER